MRVIYKSFFYKVFSVLRFFIAKAYYLRKFQATGLSMIGRQSGIYIKGKGRLVFHGRAIVNDQVMLFTKGQLEIGSQFGINSYSRIVAHESIIIGDHVTIGQNVAILDHDHRYQKHDGKLRLDGYQTAPIKIGSHVWIGDQVTVLKGVEIGDNVVIGAHSLVLKNVPSNSVVAGNPLKVLKEM